jgi:hypothetical protein
MYKCHAKKCKGREVPVTIREIPASEKPAGITAVAYRVKCYMCNTHLCVIDQDEYTAYLKPGQGFKRQPNPNALAEECYLCGKVEEKTVPRRVPPILRLVYTGFGSGRCSCRMVCTTCNPYPQINARRKIVAIRRFK